MPIVTDITKLSQTAASNGPDGSVDPPSSLDDQDRYLGSFIAMLRDGVGFTAGAPIVALGYTPVRQGGNSTGTTANMVSIGYNPTLGKIVCAIDTNQFANKWPIDTTGDAGSVNGQVFSWANSSNQPTYVWGANASGAAFLAAPAGMNVASANNAAACSGNAATCTTASNANAVNGISGWSYANQGNNPAYLWCTEGSAQRAAFDATGQSECELCDEFMQRRELREQRRQRTGQRWHRAKLESAWRLRPKPIRPQQQQRGLVAKLRAHDAGQHRRFRVVLGHQSAF